MTRSPLDRLLPGGVSAFSRRRPRRQPHLHLRPSATPPRPRTAGPLEQSSRSQPATWNHVDLLVERPGPQRVRDLMGDSVEQPLVAAVQ